MDTGLIDKLHLAFGQVEEKTTLKFSFPGNPSLQSLPKSTARLLLVPHRSVLFCLYHPPQNKVQIQDSRWLRFPHVQPTASELLSLPHHPREGPCSTSTLHRHRQHIKPLLHSLPSPHSSGQWQFIFFPSFLYSLKAMPPRNVSGTAA